MVQHRIDSTHSQQTTESKTHPWVPSYLIWGACLCVVMVLSLTQCSPSVGTEEKGQTEATSETVVQQESSQEKPAGPEPTPEEPPTTADTSEPPQVREEPPAQQEPAGVDASESTSTPEEAVVEEAPPEEPPRKACSSPPTSAWQALKASTYNVGDFSIEVGSNNIVQVLHKQKANQILFQVTRQSPVIATQVDLTVKEHQGSFDIKEKVKLTCKLSQIEQVAVDGTTFSLQGSFKDTDAGCKNLKFEWNFCEAGTGHLRYVLRSSDTKFNSLSMQLASTAKERLFGMGVQFLHNGLNLKGKKIPALAQEGGVGRGHQPISAAVNVASPGSAGSETTTYYAMPYFMTERWSSFLLENTELSYFDFTADNTIVVQLYSNEMRGRILSADSPLQMIERLTEYTGRMPALPDWVNNGAILALARSLKDSEKHVNDLLAKGAKIAGVWNQTWPGKMKTFIGEQVLWNWAYNPNYHPDWSKYVKGLSQKGIRTLCYINPMFNDVPKEAGKVTRNLFKEGNAKGYFVRNAKGDTYMIKVTAFDVGLLDLTNPAARTWMKQVIKDEMLKKAECSGWMADFAEALPFDAVLHSKVSAATYHNQYPVDWIKLNKEALQETGNLGKILVFNRSGFTTSPKYSMLLWQGDQLTTWDKYDGFVSALHGIINGGLSGVSLNHSDTGGYTSLSYLGLGYDREAELLKRWAEMNAFTAVLRTHEGNQPPLNAQVYSNSDAMEHFARMTKIYTALGFYRKTLFKEAETKGWPVVRHLMLHFPKDTGSRDVSDQFMLGSQFLVAPIKNKCWTKPLCPYNKEVYLPPGRWVHLWSGKVYGSKAQGSKVKVKAPIGKPAVFYPEGSTAGKTFVQNLKTAKVSGLP